MVGSPTEVSSGAAVEAESAVPAEAGEAGEEVGGAGMRSSLFRGDEIAWQRVRSPALRELYQM